MQSGSTRKHYADHSREILAELVKSTGRERGACKTLLFNMLYGGKTATWLSEHKVTADKVLVAFTAMRDEVLQSAEALLTRYPVYTEHAECTKEEAYFNLPRTALSLLAQTSKKHVLVAMYKHFANV
jgi:hypothetical protein